MSTPIDDAAKLTGFDKSVIAFLYDEFCESDEEEDFFEYLAEYVGDAAFIIAASGGAGIDACLEAYSGGKASVLDPDFSIDEAIEAIHTADDED